MFTLQCSVLIESEDNHNITSIHYNNDAMLLRQKKTVEHTLAA